MWIPDLETYSIDRYSELQAVGYLENGKPYPTGIVEATVISRLKELIDASWRLALYYGCHSCDFCSDEMAKSGSEIAVPGDRVVYRCPTLIAHYIEQHSYCPPSIFCDAVLSCPRADSIDLFDAFNRNGLKIPRRVYEKCANGVRPLL